METVSAYPLHWPVGYPRTKHPRKSPFSTSFAAARDGLRSELLKFSAQHIVFSTNAPLKANGDPYAKHPGIQDTAVAVYFTLRGEPYVLACDFYIDLAANMQSLHKTVEALRGIERWGSIELLKRAFTGFKALPPTLTEPAGSWYEVLEISPTASREEIAKAYRTKVKLYHPQGSQPNEQKLREIVEAYELGSRMTG